MNTFHKVTMEISENQFDNLRKGKTIQISGKKLKSNKHHIFVGDDLYEKIMKAKKQNKGVRFSLNDGEFIKTAEGLRDFLKKAKKWYDKHIKSTVGPLIRKGVEKLGNIVIDEAENLIPVAKPILEKGRRFIPGVVNKIADFSGAFGMLCTHCGHMIPMERNMLGGNMYYSPYNYTMNEQYPYGQMNIEGGSFRPVGYP